MYLKPKRLINHYEERMLEFLQTCFDDRYKLFVQVSLSQICQPESIIKDVELRKFLFSASSVDVLITDTNFMPCLVVDCQSSYHDSPESKERDRKKASLLSLAGVPVIYSRIQDFGLLKLYSERDFVLLNLFTGEGREESRVFIQQNCIDPSQKLGQLKIVNG